MGSVHHHLHLKIGFISTIGKIWLLPVVVVAHFALTICLVVDTASSCVPVSELNQFAAGSESQSNKEEQNDVADNSVQDLRETP